MKKSMELYMNAAGWVIGLVGAGYAIGVHCKMNALAKKLDCKIDRLADDAAIQIPDYIIKDAVDKAVMQSSWQLTQLLRIFTLKQPVRLSLPSTRSM